MTHMVFSGARVVLQAMNGMRDMMADFARSPGLEDIVLLVGSKHHRPGVQIAAVEHLGASLMGAVVLVNPSRDQVYTVSCSPVVAARTNALSLVDPCLGQVQDVHWGRSALTSKRSVLLKSGYMNV